MKRSLALEDFASAAAAMTEPEPEPAMADDVAALDAYEAGYKTGWADCAAAEAEVRKSVGADLAQRLREAELTYAEARNDVLKSLEPFLDELMSTLLPRVASESIAPLAVHELLQILQHEASDTIEIVAGPGSCEAIERLIPDEMSERVVVQVEPAFAESQVSLTAGSERREIDLSEATQRIAEAIRAFRSPILDLAVTQQTESKGAA